LRLERVKQDMAIARERMDLEKAKAIDPDDKETEDWVTALSEVAARRKAKVSVNG